MKTNSLKFLAAAFALALSAGLAPSKAQAAFTDNLDSQNTSIWTKSDGWTNGSMFNVGWKADHITFSGGIMTLRLDNVASSGKPYSSGEYRTINKYGYGRVEGTFKTVRGSGIVTSLFTYTGPSDGDPWDEIDIEILGKDPTKMQCNYFTNGVGGHETLINLGFDSSTGFHSYAFEWSASSIKWFVKQGDGSWLLVHTENGSRGPLPTHPGKIMANMWAAQGVDSWTGSFTYSGPLYAQYDQIYYGPAGTSGSGSTSTGDATPPSVSITAPIGGASVSGSVAVSASASDNVGVAGVQFKLDGVNLGAEDTTSPYGVTWDTTLSASGGHTLTAVARDAAGNTTTSASVSVTQGTPTSATAFTFAAAGDLGWNDFGSPASFSSLGASGAEFFLALGDMSYGAAGTETSWCNYVKSKVAFPFQLVSGNHEEDGGPNGWIQNFKNCLPDRLGVTGTYGAQYYFDYKGLARIIMTAPNLTINGLYYNYKVGTPHYNWLASTIDSARAAGIPWVIVGMHEDCITVGGKSCEIGPDLMNLLIAKRVDLVLQGHDHIYERSKQLTCATVNSYNSACVADDGADNAYNKGAGTIFLLAGAFGRPLYSVNTGDSEAGYFTSKIMGSNLKSSYGYMKYTVSASQIQAQFVATYGTFSDSFTINKVGGDTTAPTVSVTAPAAGSTQSGSAVTVSANASDNVGVAGVQFKLDGANLGAEDTSAPYSVSWNTTLASNAAHTLTAVARDAAGNSATSAAVSVTVSNTTADTTAPIISGVSASNLTASAATISWTTNEASDSQVEYGLSTAYGLATSLNGSLVASHSTGLSGLSASTVYHYRVKSRDSAGNLATSGDYTFTTGAAAPAGTSFSDTFDSGAPTGWTPVSGTWGVSSGRYSQSNLALYRALTIAGSTWGDVTVQADINIVSGGQDLNQILLRYIDANNYVAAYISKYWGCIGLEQMQGGARTYSQVALAPAYNTWYTIKAVATGGQAQVYLNGALKHTWTLPNGTTQGKIGLGNSVSTALFDNVAAGAGAASDTSAPVISGAASSNVTASAAAISWTTNEASDSQVEYGLSTAYGQQSALNASLSTSHGVSLSGLSPGTVYHYRVKSRDQAGNLAVSGDLTFSTLSAGDTTAPTALIQSPASGETVGLDIKVTATGLDNVGVSRVELWGDGKLRATQAFAPAVPSFTTTLIWSGARKGQRKLQVFAYDAAGNKGGSALVTVTASRSGIQVYLVSSEDAGQSSEEEPRALMLSLQQSRGASLAFSEDVQDAAIVDLHGRAILHQSKQASPILMKLQEGSAGRLPMEAGLWLIQMKDSSGRRTVKPLMVVK